MPKRAVLLLDMRSQATTAIWLLATLATLTAAFPAAQDDDDSSGPLPFLQFTKGGIRVNFGGYHAQAGLGGLLTGSKADGGLHASAGTDGGLHASAGLGGSLDGGPAGGLHARAGLGNGGPEAEAGLSGTLAGPRPRGALYAGSTAGNAIERSETSPESKNVQVIPRIKKDDQELASSATDTVSKVKEPSSSPTSSSSSTSSSTSSGVTANAGASTNDEDESVEKSEHPARWYFQKRLRERAGGLAASTTSRTTAHEPIVVANEQTGTGTEIQQPTQDTPQEPTKPAKKYRPSGIFARATAGDDDGNGRKHKSTLFDDIFNIPISALNAVNQLLRNHVVGKK